jgi:predicted nucleotidyltransferase
VFVEFKTEKELLKLADYIATLTDLFVSDRDGIEIQKSASLKKMHKN